MHVSSYCLHFILRRLIFRSDSLYRQNLFCLQSAATRMEIAIRAGSVPAKRFQRRMRWGGTGAARLLERCRSGLAPAPAGAAGCSSVCRSERWCPHALLLCCFQVAAGKQQELCGVGRVLPRTLGSSLQSCCCWAAPAWF